MNAETEVQVTSILGLVQVFSVEDDELVHLLVLITPVAVSDEHLE